MSIYLTGDIHGDVEKRFFSWNAPWQPRNEPGSLCSSWLEHWLPSSKNDTLIILGDFGVLWYDKEDLERRFCEELHLLKLLDKLGCTVLFLDGNHENHPRLKSLPTVRLFGAPAGKVENAERVFHLRRGEIYEIEGKSFFVMGGATSVDRARRIPGSSWWPGENVTAAELRHGLDNLFSHGNSVDYVLTHTAPLHISLEMFPDERGEPQFEDPTAEKLEKVFKRIAFKQWFFGHMHVNRIIQSDPRFVALFDRIVDLDRLDEAELPLTGEVCATRFERKFLPFR